MNWRDHIDRDPAVIGGKPKIAGTRIGVELVLERLGDGWTVDQLIEAYPRLSPAQIHACQAYAAAILAEVSMTKEPDPIIEEIHEVRRAIAKRFGGNIRKISEDARKRQQREGRPVWHPEAASQTAEPADDAAQGHGRLRLDAQPRRSAAWPPRQIRQRPGISENVRLHG